MIDLERCIIYHLALSPALPMGTWGQLNSNGVGWNIPIYSENNLQIKIQKEIMCIECVSKVAS